MKAEQIESNLTATGFELLLGLVWLVVASSLRSAVEWLINLSDRRSSIAVVRYVQVFGPTQLLQLTECLRRCFGSVNPGTSQLRRQQERVQQSMLLKVGVQYLKWNQRPLRNR